MENDITDWSWVCILTRKIGKTHSKIILNIQADSYEQARMNAIIGMPGWKLLTLVKKSSNSK